MAIDKANFHIQKSHLQDGKIQIIQSLFAIWMAFLLSRTIHIGRYGLIDPYRYRICDIHIGRYAHIGPYEYPIFDIHIGRYALIGPFGYPICDFHIGRYANIGRSSTFGRYPTDIQHMRQISTLIAAAWLL